MGIEDRISGNIIIDKLKKCYDNMTVESSMDELKLKKNIVLLRSAKEDIFCKFLKNLDDSGYAGKIYIIGRNSDEECILKFKKLDLTLFAIENEQVYTTENTNKYIEALKPEAVCFLYQNKISIGHENLLQIIVQAEGAGYAISNQLNVVKFIELNPFITGKRIYDELCDWFYEVG